MKRRTVPPTWHLRSAIRKIDEVAFRLYDEQLAAYMAYVLAVSKGEKREIQKLFRANSLAFGDLAVTLERKLTVKERLNAMRLTAYESEIAGLHDAAKQLRSRMESAYGQQRRFKNGVVEEWSELKSKAPVSRLQ